MRRDHPRKALSSDSRCMVPLRTRGFGEAEAADLRSRLSTFAEDWDRPEMAIYDETQRGDVRLVLFPNSDLRTAKRWPARASFRHRDLNTLAVWRKLCRRSLAIPRAPDIRARGAVAFAGGPRDRLRSIRSSWPTIWPGRGAGNRFGARPIAGHDRVHAALKHTLALA